MKLLRPLVALAAAAAVLGAATPARADNVTLVTALIRWSAVAQKDAGALGPAVDRGPGAADAAALRLQRDSAAAGRAIAAITPSSALGVQVRDEVVVALGNYRKAALELHLAVAAAQRNDAGGARTHATRALAVAKLGGGQLTHASKLLAKLKL
jgi:hypothetical protein